MAVILADGPTFDVRVEQIYGSPANPMTPQAHLAKFRRNWASGALPLPEASGEALIARVNTLELIADVTELVDLLTAGPTFASW